MRTNFPTALLFAVLLTLAHLVQYWGYGGAALPPIRAVLLIMCAYMFHRTIVSDWKLHGLEAILAPGLLRAARFAGVMLMVLLPILVLGLCLTIPELARLVPRGWFLSFTMLMVVLYGCGMVLLGTALPEIAATGKVSLTRAIGRGRRNYRRIARAMIWGPWIFGATHALCMMVVHFLGVPRVVTGQDPGWMIPVWLTVRIADSGGHVFAAALTSAVLARAWLEMPDR